MFKVYQNEVRDLVDNFFLAVNITYMPRDYNQTTDSLALETTYFKVPKLTHLKYLIEIRYIPSIPDNIKHWKFFHDDQEIKEFLQLTNEFSNSLIDQDQDID